MDRNLPTEIELGRKTPACAPAPGQRPELKKGEDKLREKRRSAVRRPFAPPQSTNLKLKLVYCRAPCVCRRS